MDADYHLRGRHDFNLISGGFFLAIPYFIKLALEQEICILNTCHSAENFSPNTRFVQNQ